jgi:iron complex transport system substrate-binding protein
MLFAISAERALVGVSSFDDYPPAARKLPKMGSFSGPDLERIVAARPDLVVAAYGNPRELVDRLRRMNLPVYVSNPASVDGVLQNMSDLGRLTGQEVKARQQVHALKERLRQVAAIGHGQPSVKTLVVIWDEPLTVAGGKSFIQDILRQAGGVNVAAGLAEAYPKLDPERLLSMDPEVVLFPVVNEPARVERLKQRPGFRQTRAARAGRVYTLNPDWLMRPGPRVILGVEAVARLLHPSPSRHQASR